MLASLLLDDLPRVSEAVVHLRDVRVGIGGDESPRLLLRAVERTAFDLTERHGPHPGRSDPGSGFERECRGRHGEEVVEVRFLRLGAAEECVEESHRCGFRVEDGGTSGGRAGVS